jgi:hypothetical protein
MHPIRLAFSLTALALLSALPAAAQEMMVAPPPPMRAGTRAPAFSSRTLAGKADLPAQPSGQSRPAGLLGDLVRPLPHVHADLTCTPPNVPPARFHCGRY